MLSVTAFVCQRCGTGEFQTRVLILRTQHAEQPHPWRALCCAVVDQGTARRVRMRQQRLAKQCSLKVRDVLVAYVRCVGLRGDEILVDKLSAHNRVK